MSRTHDADGAQAASSAVVVYESMYGNTLRVAQAVAEGIREIMPAEVVEVGRAPRGDSLRTTLLVVGAPTHHLGLSRSTSRQDAQSRVRPRVISPTRGVRDWFADRWTSSLPAAAFDTRTDNAHVPGHARKAIERRLRRAGCRVLAPAESFAVRGYEGPPRDGELDRARAWGRHLAVLVIGSSSRT